MRECDAQPEVLAASCRIIIHGYVCVVDSCSLLMRTGKYNHDQYYIVSVIYELNTVCVTAMRSLECLLHPARLSFMATFVLLIAAHSSRETLDAIMTSTTSCQ